jgi:folate-binding protein YgfZ
MRRVPEPVVSAALGPEGAADRPAYQSPLMERPGAVAAQGADAGTAWHYGDPVAEQRRLEAAEAVVDLSHRAVLTVSGPDRLSWLHSLTTQHLSDLPSYTSREALVLSPTGHVEHSLHVVDDGARTWVTTEPGRGAGLLGWLERMRFMLRVEVADVSERYAVLGEMSADEGAAGGPIVWVDPWPGPVGDTACYGPLEHPAAGRRWREVVVPRDRLESAVAGRPLAGTWAAEALRVAAWRPRLGFETDHRTIVHEVDWLRTAVHLHKGCYRGQETVARVHNLGRPPRRVVFLHLDGSENVLPAHGASVLADERPVGTVTSSARHAELGPIALAVVRRSVDPELDLVVDGVAAAQEVVVAP